MSVPTIESVLSKYLPEKTVPTCTRWIIHKNIHLRITGMRASKLGDYRPLERGKGHRITVNHDLNPFAFLITFTHEVAHLNCFEKYGSRHEPHGREWKHEFRLLMSHFLGQNVFPDDLETVLHKHLHDPPSSSCHDIRLSKTLRMYDTVMKEQVLHLDELPAGKKFRLHGTRKNQHFIKGPKRRTRFRCEEAESGAEYYISAIAEVIPVD